MKQFEFLNIYIDKRICFVQLFFKKIEYKLQILLNIVNDIFFIKMYLYVIIGMNQEVVIFRYWLFKLSVVYNNDLIYVFNGSVYICFFNFVVGMINVEVFY